MCRRRRPGIRRRAADRRLLEPRALLLEQLALARRHALLHGGALELAKELAEGRFGLWLGRGVGRDAGGGDAGVLGEFGACGGGFGAVGGGLVGDEGDRGGGGMERGGFGVCGGCG